MIKFFIFISLVLLPLTSITSHHYTAGPLNSVTFSASDCSWKGIQLYGRVQFVESFPDLKIQVVESFPDLKVKLVESFPDECGEWQIVESFPDFKVQVVESFPDLKIEYVEAFPGIP